MNRRIRTALVLCTVALVAFAGVARAQEEEKKKWSNDTELSLVSTQGNSDTLAFGLKDVYQKFWEKSRFQFKLEGTQASKADDRFVVIELSPPGIDPADPCTTGGACRTVEPAREDSIERYLVEGRYDRDISERTFWNVGASWDRNLTDGSGIENRYIGFAGIGNKWWDRDDLKFITNYGVSYTDREETTVDPLKDDTFAGLRFDWAYLNKFGKSVTYTNTWSINYSLDDSDDYNFDMINAITVAMSERIALKVSLQWLYNNLPPLQTVDLECANPDPNDPRPTIPCNLVCVDGNGNIDPQCNQGSVPLPEEVDIRKDKTDLIFNTSLVIKL